MSDETKKLQEIEIWLNQERQKGNPLAETYVTLLQNANPEIKAKYYLILHEMREMGRAMTTGGN
jgi:hypothetical protein